MWVGVKKWSREKDCQIGVSEKAPKFKTYFYFLNGPSSSVIKYWRFLQEDNSFTVQGLSSGSYLVEVACPDYYYEPVRVDINSKGKIRARKVSNVQPSQVY